MAFCTYSCDHASPEPNELETRWFNGARLREGDVVKVLVSYTEPLILPLIVEANIPAKTKKYAKSQRRSIRRAH